jgi:beta-carotene 3-hydroxylase
MTALAVVLAAFVVMEPVTYLAHRYVMHGLGRRLHRSHHRRWPNRSDGEPFFEANDAFPAMFAGVVMVAMAIGFNVDGLTVLLPVTVGVTLYGIAYALVHDGYIHGRLPVPVRHPLLDRLAEAHALHHRFGGEPYGMLVPVVPASVRKRAAQADEARLTRTGRR